jgi:hypothetical protein
MPQLDYRKINLNDLPRKSEDIFFLIDADDDGWELVAITRNIFAYMKRPHETITRSQEAARNSTMDTAEGCNQRQITTIQRSAQRASSLSISALLNRALNRRLLYSCAGLAQINALGNLSGFFFNYMIGWIKDETGPMALMPIAAVAAIGTISVLTLGRNQPRTVPAHA